MAIITTPGAGVSPYQSSDTDPTVLRAAADGTTVLANATTADATGANTSVYVAGQAAVNSLITSGQSGVFQGANVNITLEEQNFNTTNQVTSTINYASGAAGSIQYNNGANGFASSDYFTYTSGNVVTPGIRTNNYLYANGAPFIGGGNAAIGNFVFTGDTMSISDDANISLNIKGNSLGNNDNYITINPTSVDIYAFNSSPYSYSELYLDNGNTEAPYAQIIVDGNSTPQQTWSFAADGNLTLPSNTSSINYANGDPYGGTVAAGNAGDIQINVAGNIGADSTLRYVDNSGEMTLYADYLNAPGIFTSDIYAGDGSPSNLTITTNYGNATWTFKSDGNLSLPTAGNIVGAVNIIGNGTGNVNVIANNRAWTFAADGNLVLPLAGNIVNYGNTWNFGYNGTTQFPGNLLHPPAGNPLDIQVTVGNAYSTVSLYETGSQLIIQDNTTGPNPAWALFEADLANVNTPQAVVILKPGDTGNEVRWYFDALGNLTLPGNIIAINYANGNRVTGNITFRDEIVIGTGTSNLISGLYLAPSSSSADANMYLRVRGNINDEPTHIHFDTGNNQYYNQFIGDDNKYIQLANTGNIVINSNNGVGNSAQWTFGTNSILTLPGNSRVAPVGANIEIQAAAGGYAEIVTSDGNSYVAVTTSGAEIVTSGVYTWNFNNVGTLTTPGVSGNITGANVISANVYTAPGNVTVTAGVNSWIFETGGNLTFPTGMHVNDEGANTRISQDAGWLKMTAGNIGSLATGWAELEGTNSGNIALLIANGTGPGYPGNIAIRTGNISSTSYSWFFGNDGNLTLPNGAMIKDTAGNSVAFGKTAGDTGQGISSVAIGYGAGLTNQGNQSVAIGENAGANQGSTAVAIGQNAGGGVALQGDDAVAIGHSAGANTQGTQSVAIGLYAGETTQGIQSVAIGSGAGYDTQGANSVAIGSSAGNATQGIDAVAVGVNAGGNVQGNAAVAVGLGAGYDTQGIYSVAVGPGAGQTSQGSYSVAIGVNAGNDTQGANSIAIGGVAGQSAQGNNSIIINATGVGLNAATANTFTVKPVRGDSTANLVGGGFKAVYYNSSTGEFAYSTD